MGVIAELGDFEADDATEDVTVMRASWSGRPLAHRGRRRQVPAGLAGHRAHPAVMVTPAPAQLQIPLWVAGASAGAVAASLLLPAVVTAPADIDPAAPAAPARCTLTGDLDTDRQAVIEWSAAGATHLLCALSGSATLDTFARWLLPEVGTVGFPRVVADSPLPERWPRQDTRGSDQ